MADALEQDLIRHQPDTKSDRHATLAYSSSMHHDTEHAGGKDELLEVYEEARQAGAAAAAAADADAGDADGARPRGIPCVCAVPAALAHTVHVHGPLSVVCWWPVRVPHGQPADASGQAARAPPALCCLGRRGRGWLRQ